MEPLKHFFDEARVRAIAARLGAGGVGVDGFVEEALPGLDALELLDRGRHLARRVRPRLPPDPAEALAVLVGTFGPEHATDELLGVGMGPFVYLPDAFLIEELGVLAPEAGLDACHALTRRFTAEKCVRPILDAWPELAWARLETWTRDPSPHVRRLVSEGTRPRLPWAPRLRSREPGRAVALLDRLVDDGASVVRRSVANHLGDVAKDDLALGLDTAERWLLGHPDRGDIVRHGLRCVVKAGDARALALLGFAGDAVTLEQLDVPATVGVGDRLRYAFVLRSTADTAQRLVVDVVVTFRKLRGTSDKVFKVATPTLAPGARETFGGSVSFAVHSTRRPLPGAHGLAVQVNGRRVGSVRFEVTETSPSEDASTGAKA